MKELNYRPGTRIPMYRVYRLLKAARFGASISKVCTKTHIHTNSLLTDYRILKMLGLIELKRVRGKYYVGVTMFGKELLDILQKIYGGEEDV